MTDQNNSDTPANGGAELSAERAAARRKSARALGFKSLPTTESGKRERFLRVLRESANISRAARAAGIPSSTAYRWRKQLVMFRQAWDEAMNEALDNLEEVLRYRAMNGVERPHFHGGEVTGYYRTYSDTLGISILRARRPGIFGAEATEESGSSEHAALSVAEQLDRIAAQVKAREDSAAAKGQA